jgi:hypothetical protein
MILARSTPGAGLGTGGHGNDCLQTHGGVVVPLIIKLLLMLPFLFFFIITDAAVCKVNDLLKHRWCNSCNVVQDKLCSLCNVDIPF